MTAPPNDSGRMTIVSLSGGIQISVAESHDQVVEALADSVDDDGPRNHRPRLPRVRLTKLSNPLERGGPITVFTHHVQTVQ